MKVSKDVFVQALLVGFLISGIAISQEPEPISQLAWKLKATSSFNPRFQKIGDYAFDGQPGTLWESASQIPATLDINLGHLYEVQGFTYLPRQEGPWGRIEKYKFYVSRDGTDWGRAVSEGELLKDRGVQTRRLSTSKTGQYVRFQGLTTYVGSGVSLAELNVLGRLSGSHSTPVVTITSPIRYYPGVHTYEPVNLQVKATASQKNGQDPVQMSFYDKEKLLGTDDSAPFSWSIADLPAGTLELTAMAKYSDDTEATSQKVNFVIRSSDNGIPMARTNWQLQFVDSWKAQTDVGPAPGQKSFDGDPFTWWVTEWESPHTVKYPHVIEIDMGESCSLGGFLALPPQDPGTWGTAKDYAFFTSTDGRSWGTPVAKGTFEYPTPYKQKEQEVHFPFVEARYIKLKIVSGYNADNQVLRLAEIYVLKKGPVHRPQTTVAP